MFVQILFRVGYSKLHLNPHYEPEILKCICRVIIRDIGVKYELYGSSSLAKY